MYCHLKNFSCNYLFGRLTRLTTILVNLSVFQEELSIVDNSLEHSFDTPNGVETSEDRISEIVKTNNMTESDGGVSEKQTHQKLQ